MYTLHYTIQNDQCDYTGRLRDENIFVYFSRLAGTLTVTEPLI